LKYGFFEMQFYNFNHFLKYLEKEICYEEIKL